MVNRPLPQRCFGIPSLHLRWLFAHSVGYAGDSRSPDGVVSILGRRTSVCPDIEGLLCSHYGAQRTFLDLVTGRTDCRYHVPAVLRVQTQPEMKGPSVAYAEIQISGCRIRDTGSLVYVSILTIQEPLYLDHVRRCKGDATRMMSCQLSASIRPLSDIHFPGFWLASFSRIVCRTKWSCASDYLVDIVYYKWLDQDLLSRRICICLPLTR